MIDFANLHMMDASRVAPFTRFPAGNWDWRTEFFTPQSPNGTARFQKYLDMFRDNGKWDSDFPVILNVSPNSVSRVVEGHRRAITWAWLKNPEKIPVLHCYDLEETEYCLREIYGLELRHPKPATH